MISLKYQFVKVVQKNFLIRNWLNFKNYDLYSIFFFMIIYIFDLKNNFVTKNLKIDHLNKIVI